MSYRSRLFIIHFLLSVFDPNHWTILIKEFEFNSSVMRNVHNVKTNWSWLHGLPFYRHEYKSERSAMACFTKQVSRAEFLAVQTKGSINQNNMAFFCWLDTDMAYFKRYTKESRWDETALGVKKWQATRAVVPTTQFSMTHSARHCFTPNAASSHLPSFPLHVFFLIGFHTCPVNRKSSYFTHEALKL